MKDFITHSGQERTRFRTANEIPELIFNIVHLFIRTLLRRENTKKINNTTYKLDHTFLGDARRKIEKEYSTS